VGAGATSSTGRRPWHHPCDGGFAGMKNGGFHQDFKGKTAKPSSVWQSQSFASSP
jgi:hypothetical protein